MEEEYIFQELTENKSGKLSSLDDLGKYGKVFFYVCTHLLLGNNHKNTYSTFKFLASNKNIKVDQNEVISILSNYVESGNYLMNKKKKNVIFSINNHIKSNKENKRPKQEPDWLVCAKSQCGKHEIPQMAKLLNIPRQTLRSRFLR